MKSREKRMRLEAQNHQQADLEMLEDLDKVELLDDRVHLVFQAHLVPPDLNRTSNHC